MSRLRYPFTEVSARCRLCGAEGLTASSEHALGGRLIDWRRSHAPVCPEWPRWAEKKGLRLDERGALLYPSETGPYEPRVRPKVEDAEVQAEDPIEADVNAAQLPAPAELADAPSPAELANVPAPAKRSPGSSDSEGVSPDPLERAPAAVSPARLAAFDPGEDAGSVMALGRDEDPVDAVPPGEDVVDAPERLLREPVENTRSRGLWLVPDADTPEAAADGEPTVSSGEGDVDAPEPIPLPIAGATPRRSRRAADNSPRSSRETAPDVDLMEVPIERLRQAELF